MFYSSMRIRQFSFIFFMQCWSFFSIAQTAVPTNPIGSNQPSVPQFSAVASSLVSGVTYNIAISESPRGGANNQYIDWWVKGNVSVNDLLPTNTNRLIWSSGWTHNIRSAGHDGAVTSSTVGSPTSLTPGKTYYWHIVGTNGTKSVQVSFTVTSLPAQPTPQIVNNLNRKLFEISWNSVSNVSRYELYRNNNLVYSGMATSFEAAVGTAGVNNIFTIKACNQSGCTVGSSANGNFPVPPLTPVIQNPSVAGTASPIPLFSITTSSLASTATYTVAISESPRSGLNNQYIDYWSVGSLSSSNLTESNPNRLAWNANWTKLTRNGNPDGAVTIVSTTSPPSLTVGKTYYWHVVASGTNGGLSKSLEGRFIVSASSSSAATMSSSSFSSSIVPVTTSTIVYQYDDLGRLKTISH